MLKAQPTLCDLMDCSLPGSSVYGVSQARILEWVVISSSRGSSWLRDWTHVASIGRQILYLWATGKPLLSHFVQFKRSSEYHLNLNNNNSIYSEIFNSDFILDTKLSLNWPFSSKLFPILFFYCLRLRLIQFSQSYTSLSSVQFSSVTQSNLTLCDPMGYSMPGFSVYHQLPELAQTYVHCFGDAIQPSYPLSSPFLPAFNLSQHQGLFKWVSSSHQVAKVWEFQIQHQSFQWIFRTDFL